MTRVLTAAILAIAAGGLAYAQDPAPGPDPNAPPTQGMDEPTPQMKAPDNAQPAPTDRVGESVPPTKDTDPQSATSGTASGNFTPSEDWVGRAVYSSDDKDLGEVAKLNGSDIYVDIGGFLGIGETRALIKADQILDVRDDRIVLKLSEAEAKKLPAADAPQEPASPAQ
jgi:hypothetical protein